MINPIVATARADGIGTLYIKAGDGTGTWSQFSRQLVSTLHANGLRVCAWQYVYGTHPLLEAGVGGAAVRSGADCLAIDAEGFWDLVLDAYGRAAAGMGPAGISRP